VAGGVALSLTVAILGLWVTGVATQGLTDGLDYLPPTAGAYAYSPPGSWFPGVLGFPDVGASYVDPVFGVAVRRMTDEFPNPSSSDIYAKNGFWNADGTRFYQHRPSGFVIVDTRTGDVVRTDVPSGDVNYDVSFDPADPDALYYWVDAELWKYVMSADASRRVKTFPARLQSLGGSVDWIDRTGRFMLVAYGDGLHVWDKETDTIYEGTIPGAPTAGWAGLSPDGRYVIVTDYLEHRSYAIDHATQTLAIAGTLFWTLCGDHGDVVSASDGKTYLITLNCDDESAVYLVDVSVPQTAADIDKQKRDNVRLFVLDWADDAHFSCAARGVNQDWCFVSVESADDTFANPGPWRPYKQEIVMVQTISPYTVRRLAHHRSRSIPDNYAYEPRISASWDGTKVAWASNYGYDPFGVGYADLFEVDLDVAPLVPLPPIIRLPLTLP